MDKLELGYNIPAEKGMSINEIQTPSLVIDYSVFKDNLIKMKNFCNKNDVMLRPHAKMHKSIQIAKTQINIGGAHGICCQKVSEAEVFGRSGIKDILITNQICDPLKIERLVKIALLGCTISCCVDNFQNVLDIQKFAKQFNVIINIFVEYECGAFRCGLSSLDDIKEIIKLIKSCKNLMFKGIQAYNGSNQHITNNTEREKKVLTTTNLIKSLVEELNEKQLIVSGGGTGCFDQEVKQGIYDEVQVGSYVFMDAHYKNVFESKNSINFKNSLFILSSVMSNNLKNFAIVDAGLKSQSVDSGLPLVFNDCDLTYIKCSDEHGIISDKKNKLKINDKVLLVPGHCDPTCNLHNWYVVIENEVVIDIWPISARGFSY